MSSDAGLNVSEDRQELGSGTKWRNFWLMLLLAPSPMLLVYFANLWTKEAYRYFPFVILAVGWLLSLRWDRQFSAPRGWISWGAIAAGLCACAVGVVFATPWPVAIGFVIFATAFLMTARGAEDPSLIGLALPLLMLIRLPLGYDQLLVIRLQQVTTSLASVLLDVLAVPHAVNNNVIQLASRELFVAEACSGIQSVFTLAFLATLIVTIYRRPLWIAPIYLAISSLLAVFANVIRVTIVALGDVWLAVDLASGWQHELVGFFALGLGVLFLLSFDQLVISILHPVFPSSEYVERNFLIEIWNFLLGHDDPDAPSLSPTVRLAAKTPRRGMRLWLTPSFRVVLSAVFVLLFIVSIGQAFQMNRPVAVFTNTDVVYEPNESLFDDRVSEVDIIRHERTRGGSDPRLGVNSDSWFCAVDGIEGDAQFVVSQPYPEWHELSFCYEMADWILLNRTVHDDALADALDAAGDTTDRYALARFKRDTGHHAYLFFSAFDPSGDVVKPPPRPGRLGLRFFDSLYEGTASNVIMVQLFVQSPDKLDPSRLRSVAQAFIEMRDQFGDELGVSLGNVDSGSSQPSEVQ